MTIQDYADMHNISYEAVRKQVVRYSKELEGHITKKNRTQFLDEWAVEFLTERRKENPVVILNENRDEEIRRLREETETLKVQLLTIQKELLKEKDRVISLQDEAKAMIEDKAKYKILLEEKESDQKKIEQLQKERDEAKAEAEAYTRTIFGFYRKK